jgi:hypothetical protein
MSKTNNTGMKVQESLNFLSGKIMELGTAILTCQGTSEIPYQSAIVQTTYIDNSGFVFLAVNKSMHLHHDPGKNFYVMLNYYKKGKPFFLNAFGLAKAATGHEHLALPESLKNDLSADKVLLCVRILEANYHETSIPAEENYLHKWIQKFTALFKGNSEQQYFHFADTANGVFPSI